MTAKKCSAHRKLAADFGHQADAVVRFARERSQQQTRCVHPEQRIRESLTFARDKNFADCNLIGAPVRGSGIFVSGVGDTGGRLKDLRWSVLCAQEAIGV